MLNIQFLPLTKFSLQCQTLASAHDCIINLYSSNSPSNVLFPLVQSTISLDASFSSRISLLFPKESFGQRLINAPFKRSKFWEYEDSRDIGKVVREALKMTISSGALNPILLVDDILSKDIDQIVASIHQELYIPLELVELKGISCPLQSLTLCQNNPIPRFLNEIEAGRILCRDIGGSDPERMPPLKCAQHIISTLEGSGLEVEIISNIQTLSTEYPLLMAVARCSLVVPRHSPCVLKIKYSPPNKPLSSVRLIGKGITYDTGGADLKVGGAMADEIIVSRSGQTVRIGNTDAEGRLVMADLLCESKEQASQDLNCPSTLLTIATLTGHVGRAYGHCAAIVPNACAFGQKLSERLSEIGHSLGEPFAISRLYKEDFEFVNGNASGVDLVSANSKPSTLTNRGHQYPAAFMIQAAGLVGLQIPYLHLDIASVAEESFLGKPTGIPIGSLVKMFADE